MWKKTTTSIYFNYVIKYVIKYDVITPLWKKIPTKCARNKKHNQDTLKHVRWRALKQYCKSLRLRRLRKSSNPPMGLQPKLPNGAWKQDFKKHTIFFFFFFFCLQNENDEILKYLFPTEVQIKQTKKIKFCICSQLVEGEQQPIFIK